MASKMNGVEHSEYAANGQLPPRQGGKVKRHCARFWWLHLIIVILIACAIISPVIFVAYPRIAQDQINDAGLVITKQVYSNPAPEAVDLRLEGAFLTKSTFKPDISSFPTNLTLAGRTMPFTTLQFPAISGAKNGSTFVIQQRTPITDFQEVLLYTIALLGFKQVNVTSTGNGQLQVGKLQKVGIDVNITTSFNGLNGLAGLSVSNFRLGAGLPYNSTASGNVTINNPSVATISLGQLSFNLSVAGTAIGTALVPDLVLAPGNLTYPLYANINQTTVTSLLGMPAYQCGILPIDLKGNASIYNGQIIPYYTQAVQAAALKVTLDLKDTLDAANLGSLIKGSCQT